MTAEVQDERRNGGVDKRWKEKQSKAKQNVWKRFSVESHVDYVSLHKLCHSHFGLNFSTFSVLIVITLAGEMFLPYVFVLSTHPAPPRSIRMPKLLLVEMAECN